jgi:hypothetical protein
MEDVMNGRIRAASPGHSPMILMMQDNKEMVEDIVATISRSAGVVMMFAALAMIGATLVA